MERTKYMTAILNETYPLVAIEAIKNGFDGALERLIAARLRKDYNNGHSEAEVIMSAVEGSASNAAKLIINSKIPEPC